MVSIYINTLTFFAYLYKLFYFIIKRLIYKQLFYFLLKYISLILYCSTSSVCVCACVVCIACAHEFPLVCKSVTDSFILDAKLVSVNTKYIFWYTLHPGRLLRTTACSVKRSEMDSVSLNGKRQGINMLKSWQNGKKYKTFKNKIRIIFQS